MTRSKHIVSTTVPYHVTVRSHNRTFFPLSKEQLWQIYSNYLHFLGHAFKFKIYSFVLMDNHFHMIVSTPEGNLSEGMLYLQREVSRYINSHSPRINQNFANRYFRCLISNNHYYMHCYKYVYRNPIEAGLCKKAENYPYSTLYGLLGQSSLVIPIENDPLLFDSDTKNFINFNKNQFYLQGDFAFSRHIPRNIVPGFLEMFFFSFCLSDFQN